MTIKHTLLLASRAYLHHILHMVGPCTTIDKRKALFDYPNPAYLMYEDPWLITADVLNLMGKVYNLCRVCNTPTDKGIDSRAR
jgi:hypothetical protein